MSYEMRELSGSLFRNDKKTDDKHPNATGSALIGGVEYWVSAWTKEGAKGKWQSLAFTRKEPKPELADEPKNSSISDMESDIPF